MALVFDRQVLINEPEFTEDGDVQQAVFTFVIKMKELVPKGHINVWQDVCGFSIMQKFLLLTLYHLLTYHIKCSLYHQAKHIPAISLDTSLAPVSGHM